MKMEQQIAGADFFFFLLRIVFIFQNRFLNKLFFSDFMLES